MRFAASITTATEATQAVDELLTPLGERLTPGMVDLALLFVTAHYDEDIDDAIGRISEALPHAVLCRCERPARDVLERAPGVHDEGSWIARHIVPALALVSDLQPGAPALVEAEAQFRPSSTLES